MFNATCDNSTLYSLLALIREVTDRDRIKYGRLFKDADPRVKLVSVEVPEEMVNHFISLRASTVLGTSSSCFVTIIILI